MGSGDFPGFECCCDECDYYLECFPEWDVGGSAWENEPPVEEDLLRKHGIIVDPTDDEDVDEEVDDNRWLKVCRVRCKLCGDVLERTYQSRKDYGGQMFWCSCGNLGLDPDPVLWRIGYHQKDSYEILHELAEEEPTA